MFPEYAYGFPILEFPGAFIKMYVPKYHSSSTELNHFSWAHKYRFLKNYCKLTLKQSKSLELHNWI